MIDKLLDVFGIIIWPLIQMVDGPCSDFMKLNRKGGRS